MNSVIYGPLPFDEDNLRWPEQPYVPAIPQPFVPAPFPVDPPPAGADAEVAALRTIVGALDALDAAARARLVRYLASRYGSP